MPGIRFNTPLTNPNPIAPGTSQSWTSFGLQEREVIMITAVVARVPGAAQSDTLAVENVRVETTRDQHGDPTRRVHYIVRNTGASTINRYTINVAFLSP